MDIEQIDFFGKESPKQARSRRVNEKMVKEEKIKAEEERTRRLAEKKNEHGTLRPEPGDPARQMPGRWQKFK